MNESGEMNKGENSESRATSSATEPIVNISASNKMLQEKRLDEDQEAVKENNRYIV